MWQEMIILLSHVHVAGDAYPPIHAHVTEDANFSILVYVTEDAYPPTTRSCDRRS